MVKIFNYSKGKYGENEAKNYLINQNYKFIESNYNTDFGEIDLIMSDNDWLVFVEVKFKSDNFFGSPEEMIDKRKIYQIRKVADYYILNNSDISKFFNKFRIDAICILGNEIKHYKNIYV